MNPIELAHNRGVRIYVVGVGTNAGGLIPLLPPQPYTRFLPPIPSVLDRQSLRNIAETGGGRYSELGMESDQTVALKILADAQRTASGTRREKIFADLYWDLLVAAVGFLFLGTVLIKERTPLWWQLAGSVSVLVVLLA